MEKRKLGNQGLEVSALGLGCMGMNFSYAPFPEKKDSIGKRFYNQPFKVTQAKY